MSNYLSTGGLVDASDPDPSTYRPDARKICARRAGRVKQNLRHALMSGLQDNQNSCRAAANCKVDGGELRDSKPDTHESYCNATTSIRFSRSDATT